MTNVTWAESQIKVYELAVPAPASRRDVWDLLRLADKRASDLAGIPPGELADDAYTVGTRGEQIVAAIKVVTS